MDQGDTSTPKKRYRKPELREYGDLRRITESDLNRRGMHDGAFIGMVQVKSGA